MSDMKRLEDKIDKLDSRLDKMDIHFTKYNTELEFHVARTNQIEDALLPVVKHVEQVKGAGKLIMWVSTIAGIIGAMTWLWVK